MDRTFKFSPRLKKPKFQFSFQTQKGNGSSAGAANAAQPAEKEAAPAPIAYSTVGPATRQKRAVLTMFLFLSR